MCQDLRLNPFHTSFTITIALMTMSCARFIQYIQKKAEIFVIKAANTMDC